MIHMTVSQKKNAKRTARNERRAKAKEEEEARARAKEEEEARAKAKAERQARAKALAKAEDYRKRAVLIALLQMNECSEAEVSKFVKEHLVCPETYSEATEKMIDFFMGKVKLSRNQFQFIIECLYDIYDCKRVVELPADGYTCGGGVSALRDPTGNYSTHCRAGSWKPESPETAQFRLLDHICM